MSEAAATTGLLIAHGSPDARHAAALRHLTSRVVEELATSTSDIDCDLAFLEHDEPLLTNWLAHRPSRPLRAIGLLLASGYHAQIDIPQALAAAGPVPTPNTRRRRNRWRPPSRRPRRYVPCCACAGRHCLAARTAG